MLGKNHAKIILTYYEQTFSNISITFQPHKATHPYCFTLPSCHEFCGQIFENIFFFLNLLLQKLFFDKNQRFQILSTKTDLIISLFLISITLHSLSVNHSTLPSVGNKALAFDENFIAATHQVTKSWSAFYLSFVFFVCFF